MDATIYTLVLRPAMHDLLSAQAGGPVSQETVLWHGGIIFSIFLIGWAVGGILFGVLADRFGRTRTLIVTILFYALFTGMAALSATWWQLAVYRFLTALGIGGEWAAGAALVAEVWPEEKRAKAAGILQSAWAAGFFLAAIIMLLLRNQNWRWVFVVGIAPAIVALLVRCWRQRTRTLGQVPPSRNAKRRAPAAAKLLERSSSRDGSAPPWSVPGLAFVAVFGLWGATNWTPELVRSLPDLKGLTPARSLPASVGPP